MAVTVCRQRCPRNHPCPCLRACPTDALEQCLLAWQQKYGAQLAAPGKYPNPPPWD